MTLLLREIGRFLAGTGVWLVVLAAVTAAAAVPILWIGLRRVDGRDLGITVLGAASLAAIVHRVGALDIWSPDVGGRPLPVVWAAVGAAATAAVLVVRSRERIET